MRVEFNRPLTCFPSTIAIVIQLACGSGGATAPTPPSTALAPPTSVRHEVIPGFASGSADLFWTAAPGADGYVIETGTAPGAIDGRRLDVSSTDIRLTELPHKGVTYVRVRSRRGVDVSSASGEVAIRTFDLRDAIDAVFFRTGPLVPRDRTPCRAGGPTNCQTLIWRQMGSATVSLLLSADLDPTARSGLRAEVTRLAPALAPYLTITAVDSDLTYPTWSRLAIESVPRSSAFVATSAVAGCDWPSLCVSNYLLGALAPSFAASMTAWPPGSPVRLYLRGAIGRGILGFFEIDSQAIGGAHQSLMAAGPEVSPCLTTVAECFADHLTALDLSVWRTVRASGLETGSIRQQFQAAGLVNPL